MDGTVYRNRHCAMCNGVSKLLKWRIAFTCDQGQPLLEGLFPLREGHTDAAPARDLMQTLQSLR
jgi:hypothetical protein